MRALLLIAALVSLAAQQPPDETNVPDSEKRIPAGDYCKRADVTITKNEKHAHHCSCKYSCSLDATGNVIEKESSDCMSFCHVNGRHCTCWPEGDPSVSCEGSHAQALVDMDGNIVAVKVKH